MSYREQDGQVVTSVRAYEYIRLKLVSFSVRGIPVLTADLMAACPAKITGGSGGRRCTESMYQFARRWSHRTVSVDAPEEPDGEFRMMPWACDTDLIWRVTGPPELLADLEASRGLTGISFWLCRHQIVGD